MLHNMYHSPDRLEELPYGGQVQAFTDTEATLNMEMCSKNCWWTGMCLKNAVLLEERYDNHTIPEVWEYTREAHKPEVRKDDEVC